MKATIVGVCPPGQEPAELRVFDGKEHVGTFLNSVTTFAVQGHSSQVCYGQFCVTVDANPGWIRNGTRVELVVIDGNGAPSVAFVGRVDGIKIRTAKGKPTTIEFRARGLAAPLIDAGFRGNVGPTVGAVLAKLVEPAGLVGHADGADQPLVAWIDAASAFAAVRLLAINLRAVVKTHGERLDVVSYSSFLRRLNAKPQQTVTNDDFESACITEGLPFEGDDP